MSYRGIKRLLGETSLERKCRFLFGGGLMLLISGSFYFYAQLNSDLVYDQNKTMARLLMSSSLLEKHWTWSEPEEEFVRIIEKMVDDFKPDDLGDYNWVLMKEDLTSADGGSRPTDEAGYDALEQLRKGATEVVRLVPEKDEYQYYGGVYAAGSCLTCHYHKPRPDSKRTIAEGDLIGMVKITLPLERTERALAWNNAVLLATALVTAFLAMLAAYAIVRYVIVKPVLHLKDISDQIAQGNLDLRADIRTGDEYEEFSHAFNRMLRHLVTVQDELREVNSDLDYKVDELAQVNLQLYEMNKLKDDFLATVSHELRTPMNSILGFSDILSSSKNLSDKEKRFVENIQISGKNLLELINDVLDLAKIESGKMERQIVEFSISDLVQQQVAGMLPLAEKKNIDLTWQADEKMPPLFQDPGKILQILNNLLSNAIKFTPEGGRVRVEVVPVGEKSFELVVVDTGVGIRLEDQESIFEKFRQGKSIPGQADTLTREFEGTGLGLSIIRELSKLLGGEVRLESEFGNGSTFTVRLPIKIEQQLHPIDEYDGPVGAQTLDEVSDTEETTKSA